MSFNYRKEIEKALASDNRLIALDIVQRAFVETEDEMLCANLVMFTSEFGLPTLEFIHQFNYKFPNSLFPIRVYLAQMLCESSNFDDATSEARYYLRLIQDYGKVGHTEDEKLLEFNLRAYMLTTTVYIDAGARSYAKRILEIAKRYATDKWLEIYKKEIQNLNKELENEKWKSLDEKWEAFFKDGSYYSELYQLCAENRYSELAIRLRLLKEDFDTKPDFVIDENELLRIVMIDENKNYILSN
jgi:hypothetical protein